MITWMMGGKRDGPRPISTYPNDINTFYNIEQGRVVNLFSPTYMSCTITPTISYSVVRMDGMGPISNSPITTNSISIKRQQYTTLTLVRGLIVAGRRPICTSNFNMNSCSHIARGRVSDILWHISTYINISSAIKIGIVAGRTWPKSTKSAITWGSVTGIKTHMSKTFTKSAITWVIVSGLKRNMSTFFLNERHFKTFFFITIFVSVTMDGRIMDGLMIPISKTSVIPNHEWWIQGNYLWELDGVRYMGRNVKFDRLVADVVNVHVFRTPHGVPLLNGCGGIAVVRDYINKKLQKLFM